MDPPKSKRLSLPPTFQVYYELSAAAWAAARTQIRASKKSVGVGATAAAVSSDESCVVAAPALDLKEEWRHPEARLGYRKQRAPVKRAVAKGSDAHDKQKWSPIVRPALVEGARFAGDGARGGAATLRGAGSGQQQVLAPAAGSEQAHKSTYHNATASQHASDKLVHPLTALARAHGVAADARRILADSDVALLEVAALARLRAAAGGGGNGDSATALLELGAASGGCIFGVEAGSRSAVVATIDADATARLGLAVARPDYHARGTDPLFDVGEIDMHSDAIAPQLPDFLLDRLAGLLQVGVDNVVPVPLAMLANCLAYGTVSPYSLGDRQRRLCHPGTKGETAGGAAALDSLAWEAHWSTHNGATRFVAGAPAVPAHGLPGGTPAEEIAARVYQLDHEHPHLNLAP